MYFKHTISSLSIGFLVLSLSITSSFAAAKPTPVNIFVNDAQLSVYDAEVKKDMPAIILDGRTLMPLKKTFELFGLQVKWDSKNQTVETITDQGDLVWLQIGNKNAKVGGKTVPLDVPAKVIDGRTYVPLAFIAKAVGHEAKWDAKNRVVNLYTDGTEFINLGAIPKPYSNIPSRVNNRIFFDSGTEKNISVAKSELSMMDTVSTLSNLLFVQSEDFKLTVNTTDVKVAVYEDLFKGVSRSNVVISKSDNVYMIEVRGMSGKEASDFAVKLIK